MMTRKLKYILFFLLSISFLFALFVIIIAATMEDADYQKIAIRTIEYITGYEVDVEGNFEFHLSTEPYLAASNVRFEPGKGASQPYIDHIGRLQLKLSARHLFAGKLLIKQMLIDDAAFSLTVGRDHRKQSKAERGKRGVPSMLVPVIENAVLRNINIDISDMTHGSIANIGLNHLKIEDTGESGYRHVASEGVINAQEFNVEGRLGSVEQIFNSQRPYPVLMNVKTANVDFNVTGKIDDFVHGEGLGLRLSGEVADLSKTLTLFRVTCSGLGRMTFETDIAGNFSSPKISDLFISISENSNIKVTAKGSVSNIFNGDGTDVFITGSTSNNDLIRMLLPPIMGDFALLDAQCRLRKHQVDYVIEDINAHGLNDQGLDMTAFGDLNFGDLKGNFFLKEIDLDLTLTSPTTDAARRFLIDWLPEIGPVNAKGRLKGSVHGLSLEDLSIDINTSGPLNVTSKGRIGHIPTQKGVNISELDLGISIQAEKTTLLSKALDIPLPELGSTSARFRVTYADDRLRFDEVEVRTSTAKGLETAISGKVGEIPNKSRQPNGDVDFFVRMTAPNMGAAKPLLGARILHDIGPVIGEAQVTGTTEVLSLMNLVITAGQPDTVRLELRGGVGKIPVSNGRLISDCNINGLIQADKTSALGSLLGFSAPDLGPLKGTWRVVDRNGDFGFDDAKLYVGKEKGFQLEIAGKIDSILRKGKISVSGADFDLSASVINASAVSFLKDTGLSNLGPLNMTAKIHGGEDRLDIRRLFVYSGQQEAPVMLVKGDIYSGAITKKKIKINATFETQTKPWVESFMHRSVHKSHKLIGRLALVRESAYTRIEVFDVTTENQKPLSLKGDGSLNKMNGSYTLDVNVSADAKDPSILGSILGISLPSFSPLAAEGRFNIDGKNSGFDGDIRLGKTVFKTTAHRFEKNQKPHLNLIIHSPTVYLSDVGIYPQASIDEPEKKQATRPKKSHVFSREPMSLEVLKGLDLSLRIDADKLIGKNFEMNHLDFDLSLRDGRLHVGPVKLGYSGGNVSFESILKADGSKHDITIKANAEDLDVGAFLSYAHKPLILSGQLNLAVDMHGVGNSAHDIASSLKGELGVAIENGRIKRDVEMITADAFDVITSLPKIKGYQDLNCLVLKFTFEKGIGKSNIIFYDTPNVRTSGGGVVDLASESLDIVLQPKPKKGLPEFSSAIYISGPLADPSIRKMPFKEAARLAGEILMPYVFLPARALGYLWYLLKDDKDEKSPCLIEEAGGG